ncbi:uncharacterized protein LOC111042453 isoform X2 [Myzus persicae]|uniref:uncharacterized protein LOC111042453 isoform X2 n=1 Tax=Myzus persicae TaxID=13164 RepID=UPI000B93266C|nr:uncharacterized protein LOC111042453 isoform X2 [Myzus persicae]
MDCVLNGRGFVMVVRIVQMVQMKPKSCVLDCGKVYGNDSELIDSGTESLVGKLTWVVGIYELSDDIKKNIITCEGSIIAPNVVISAAQCFEQEGMLSKQISVKDRPYGIVVVGYQDNSIVKDHYTQVAIVEMIYLKECYLGSSGYQTENIAVIVLRNSITMNYYVTPVCIDWNSIYNVKNGDQGKIVFSNIDTINGTSKFVLIDKLIQYIDHTTCQKMYSNGFLQFLTFDKFCTDNKLGQSMINAYAGSGISFLHDNSYYLTGILSVTNYLSNDTVIGFTDIKYHVQWIRGILNKHFTMNICVLPIVEGVVYSYEGSNEILSHGTLISQKVTVIENCEVGYHKAYTNGFRICLGKGKWLSNFEKLCLKMCPPLESNSLDIKCSHNGKYANCSNLSIPDTIATASCKQTYIAPHGEDLTPFELLCQSNGTWNKQLYRCNPYCGREYITNKVLIDNGEKAPVGTAPWNVGLYRFNKNNSNYDLICGGSIISPNLVVSAAHCFWPKGMLSKNFSINISLYKIAVGKYSRDFSVIDNDFTQIFNVEMIHLNKDYHGPTGYHAKDIAIIVLQNRVYFSNGVAPVCMDWSGKYNVVNGDHGKIVGWGKTEKGISSPILLEASLPYIDHSSCRNMYTNGFELFVTVDKFCAGSELVSGQGVNKGDSGAGLSFNHSDFYYLTGVVSIKDPDTKNSIAVFTEVKYHIQWIHELYNKHNI